GSAATGGVDSDCLFDHSLRNIKSRVKDARESRHQEVGHGPVAAAHVEDREKAILRTGRQNADELLEAQNRRGFGLPVDSPSGRPELTQFLGVIPRDALPDRVGAHGPTAEACCFDSRAFFRNRHASIPWLRSRSRMLTVCTKGG